MKSLTGHSDPAIAGVPTIIFDGSCRMCARSMRFIEARRGRQPLRLLAAQSPEAAELLQAHGFPPGGAGSIVFIDGDRAHTKSEALLQIVRKLRAPWRWLVVLGIIPRPIRDGLYGVVARNRHRWSSTPVCDASPRS